MDNMEIYNDDCFKVFPKMKDNSVDLFVLDLPYGQTKCKWDTVINLEEMWKQVKRIMKKDAIICFFCTTKFGYTLIKSNEKWFKYDLVWKKSRKVGFLSANKRQLRNHENIYVFKQEQGTYHPQKVDGKPYVDKRSGGSRSNAYRDKLENEPVINKGDRFPTSVIEHENLGEIQGGYYRGENGKPFKRMAASKDGKLHPTSVIEHENTILEYKSVHKTIHRTEKPVGLLEYLIKSYSNEGDTVMDFTMGSGSCGEACFNTKRKFIGVEMDDDIFVLAQERLSKLEE